MNHKKNKNIFLYIIALIVIIAFCIFLLPYFYKVSLNNPANSTMAQSNNIIKSSVVQIPITHISTPEYVKAIYVSAWTIGSVRHRPRILSLLDDTELNAIVIDIKDSTGYVSFNTDNELINSLKSSEKRIPDIKELISLLHSKNVYVIGRISVFQDPYMTKKKPEWAINRKSDKMKIWVDHKGLSFLDPANKEVWNYIVIIGRTAYDVGFDEINFDYIRYPSDGNIKDINYSLGEGRTRATNIEDFFIYLHDNMKKDVNIPISADLFGLTTVTEPTDDMGIGQIIEKALPHFDFVAPMVYPSHFGSYFSQYKNPAEHPYEVVNITMKKAIERSKAIGLTEKKIRPWLQDFNMGASYTKEMVEAEMKATYDAGLNSWMLWDPKNVYTKNALKLN